MPWKNFSIWRGKLPHWRADDVRYYVTFRHSRPLDDLERTILFRQLLRPEGRKLESLIICVLPETTEMIFDVLEDPKGQTYELSKVIEGAKTRAGKQIIKKTGERFAPFYSESFDRIIRDDVELEEKWQAIFDSPVNAELAEDPEEYETLWVSGAPQ